MPIIDVVTLRAGVYPGTSFLDVSLDDFKNIVIFFVTSSF